MLMKMLRQSYREMTAPFAPVKPISTIESRRPAANANSFVRTDVKAKRHGRLRRMNRNLTHNASGWTVRTW